jgi:hypothetical protein
MQLSLLALFTLLATTAAAPQPLGDEMDLSPRKVGPTPL